MQACRDARSQRLANATKIEDLQSCLVCYKEAVSVTRTQSSFIQMLHDKLQLASGGRALCVRKRREDELALVAPCAACVELRNKKLLQHLVNREALPALAQNLRMAQYTPVVSNRHPLTVVILTGTHFPLLLLGREEPLHRLLVLKHNRVGHNCAELTVVVVVVVVVTVGVSVFAAGERRGLQPQVSIEVQRLLAERVLAGNALAPGAFAPLSAAAHERVNTEKLQLRT